jgi:hypothetical protein
MAGDPGAATPTGVAPVEDAGFGRDSDLELKFHDLVSERKTTATAR